MPLARDAHSAADPRRFAAARRNAAAARCMPDLALLLEGSPRAIAAETCGMDRQTLRDRVHRYDAAELDGLPDRCEGLGRKPLLTAVVAGLVRIGPDLATHGVVRGRRAEVIEPVGRMPASPRSPPVTGHRSLFKRVGVQTSCHRQHANGRFQ